MQIAPSAPSGVECWLVATAPSVQESGWSNPGLGGEIRRLRHAVGYSQETLASIVGVDQRQIGFLERGDSTISVHTLRLIAAALGTKLSNIFEDVDF